jgi:hypothetical protein
MKKIYQTKWDKDKGNCFQASIASLFELELNEVPDFCNEFKEYDKQWHEEFNKWLKRFGYCCLTVVGSEKVINLPELRDCYLLACVENKDGINHSVIYKNGKIVHDPNFWADEKYKIKQLDLIIPLNPLNKPNKSLYLELNYENIQKT